MSLSSVQQARNALGQRLREIRKESGLTARALAALAGWHESKCSRLEHGKALPADDDIRAWTTHCGAAEHTADLIAAARNVDGMYIEWRRMERAGLRQAQESVIPLWERTRNFRAYSPSLVSGILQTPAYTEALLRSLRDRRALVDDVGAALRVRVEKQRFLRQGGRFAILLEESVLHLRIGGPEVMGGQLRQLLSLATMPNVSLGIIPFAVDRTAHWPVEGFWLFDDEQVSVELVSAFLAVTQPHEIGMYAKTFAMLADLAVYGAAARGLITSAVDALD